LGDVAEIELTYIPAAEIAASSKAMANGLFTCLAPEYKSRISMRLYTS